MDYFEVSKKRVSYRGEFLNEPVPREDLRKIIQSGLEAPSGCNQQTTTFIVVDSPEVIRKIQDFPGGNKALKGGKAYILCIVDIDPPLATETLSFQVEDCAAATENILLAMTALGYAGVWIDGWLRSEGRAEKLAELVNLPKGKVIRIIIPLGKPAEPLDFKVKKSIEERVTFI
jgi:nitroreductase